GRLAFTDHDGACQAAGSVGAAAGGVPHLVAVSAGQPVAADRVRAAGRTFVYAESNTGSLTESTASNWDGTLGRVTRRQLVSLGGRPDAVALFDGFVGRVKAGVAKAGGT